MAYMTFVLPLNRDDLLTADSPGQYVAQVLQSNEILSRLRYCRDAVLNTGCFFILDHFDTIYSAIYNAAELDAKPLLISHNLILKGMDLLCTVLPQMLDDEPDSDTRNKLLNTAKMYLYLFSELLRTFEDKVNQQVNKEMAVDAKSRKKAAKNFTDFDWDELKNTAVIQLFNFIQQPLQKLWDPPVADEDFVNLAANCCYKVLEDPQISQVRLKHLRESMYQILGTLILRYNHGLSCTVKMVQLLKLYEHLAVPLSEAVIVFVREYGCRGFVREIIRELADAEMVYENSFPKAYSQFLLELTQRGADIVLPSMPMLIPHLESESYTLRNCVLAVMGEIIANLLSKEHLDEDARETRDLYLEYLEDYLLDNNSFVRCKVLKIWQRLCQEKAIPLSQLSHLLRHVVERLKDASWSVTRSAVQLFHSLLQSNPFGEKLERKNLCEQLLEEERVLAALEKEMSIQIPKNRHQLWSEISPELTVVLQDILSSGEAKDFESTQPLGDSLPDNIKIIVNCLDEKRYEEAFHCFRMTEKQFPAAKELSLRCDKEVGWQIDFFLKVFRKIYVEWDQSKHDGSRTDEPPTLTAEQEQLQNKILNKRTLTLFLKDFISFVEQLEVATNLINNLLFSGQPTVIQDAVEFLTAAQQFGLEGAMAGVRDMLLLVHSTDTSVKEAVASAYKTLYLNVVNASGRCRASEIVRNLCNLLKSLDEDQQSFLEVLVKEWVKNDDMDKACIQVMWERFAMTLPDTSEEDSRNSLILLGMVGGAETKTIRTNINVLVTVGFGERGRKDLRLVAETCRVMLKLVHENVSVTSNEEPVRYEQDHAIFQNLCEILSKEFLNVNAQHYSHMAYEAIDLIYQLSENPDETCALLLKRFKNDVSSEKLMEHMGSRENLNESSNGNLPPEILNRFVLFIGHISFRQWIHLDRTLFRELKRRNRIRELQNEERRGKKERGKTKDKRRSQANLNNSFLSRASETPRHKKESEDAADAEIGDITADDAEAEYINQVCEAEVNTGGNLIATLNPVVLAVCRNPLKYPDIQLRATASLALTKMMVVSSTFCEDHLRLVFTMMEKSVEPVIRSNVVYAVGDLANRFPNLIEPWTRHLYARLQDKSPQVRLDTMVVLKHLIMNEMVKVRGQISDMALCMVDSEEKISVMALQFFEELSKKGNTLYNVMPDIISRLSNPTMNVSEIHFHTIMKFLMPLIQKDRQMEGLVDKLCQRFRASTTERQWSDIAFCLSLLQYSERSIRRLTENFACYSDKLNTPKVQEAFDSIITQASKTSKPERKVLIEELSAKIDECLRKGTGQKRPTEGGEVDGEITVNNDPEMEESLDVQESSDKRGKSRGSGVRKQLTGVTRRQKRRQNSEDEEEDSEQSYSDKNSRRKPGPSNIQEPTRRSHRRKK